MSYSLKCYERPEIGRLVIQHIRDSVVTSQDFYPLPGHKSARKSKRADLQAEAATVDTAADAQNVQYV